MCGKGIVWWPDGGLYQVINFDNGKHVGANYWYCESGQPCMRWHYNQEGKRDGLQHYFKNGFRHGTIEIYINGKLHRKSHWAY